jgi:hypothetical protein
VDRAGRVRARRLAAEEDVPVHSLLLKITIDGGACLCQRVVYLRQQLAVQDGSSDLRGGKRTAHERVLAPVLYVVLLKVGRRCASQRDPFIAA